MVGPAACSCSPDTQTDQVSELPLATGPQEGSRREQLQWSHLLECHCWDTVLALPLLVFLRALQVFIGSQLSLIYHLLVLGPLWLLRHLKATFHPRGQLSPSLGQPQGWAGSAGQLREKEMGQEQLAAKGQEVLTGRTPGPHVCLDVIWSTSTAEMG